VRALSWAAAVALVGCAGGSGLPADLRPEPAALPAALADLERPGLVIGELPLADRAVIDGDTIRVQGLDATLRLLAIDTEETFKHEAERRAYAAGWERYTREQRGASPHPVKMATPVGDEARAFAERFFAGATTVRLERDHPGEVRDAYNRYLAYAFVRRDGRWLCYNVEVVRAGYAPYFTKYGYSRRFHDQLVAAEDEARAARRGIWDPAQQHDPVSAERKAWWNARADFIRAFEAEAAGADDRIVLTRDDALERLERHLGAEVVVLGAVGDVRRGARGPTRVMLARRRGADFPLVFFDEGVLAASHIADRAGEYVRVRGRVVRYEDGRRGRAQLEIHVDAPDQITASGGAR
jgi:endonuclease YncB( thermonuclease family)